MSLQSSLHPRVIATFARFLGDYKHTKQGAVLKQKIDFGELVHTLKPKHLLLTKFIQFSTTIRTLKFDGRSFITSFLTDCYRVPDLSAPDIELWKEWLLQKFISAVLDKYGASLKSSATLASKYFGATKCPVSILMRDNGGIIKEQLNIKLVKDFYISFEFDGTAKASGAWIAAPEDCTITISGKLTSVLLISADVIGQIKNL